MIRATRLRLIAVIQSVLFLTHFLFYETWIFSSAGSHDGEPLWIKLFLGSLSVSFITRMCIRFLSLRFDLLRFLLRRSASPIIAEGHGAQSRFGNPEAALPSSLYFIAIVPFC
jgi:hypothetical protein